MAGLFSVCQFFPGAAGHDYEVRNVPAARAVEVFRGLTNSVGARLGTTARVIIIDSGDAISAEWKYGEGITFPPEWVEASRAAHAAVPSCAAAMGCLCAGHARGDAADAPCDTTEVR